MDVIDLSEKLATFSDQWSPKIVAQMNDLHFKVAKIEGEFVWHSHPHTDEVFFVLDGSMVLQTRAGDIELGAGQMVVVPKGLEHNPYAQEECHLLLVEPAGTVNTGDAGGERTVEEEEWI